MHLLPSNFRLLLAASCCVLIVLGGVVGTAAFMGHEELVMVSALALVAVALGSFLLLGWQMGRIMRAQGRIIDRLSGRLTIFEEASGPQDETTAASSPATGAAQPFVNAEARETRRIEAFDRIRDEIAHDLNNRLMVIGGNVDTVARKIKDQPLLQRRLLSSLVAVDQAAALIARSSALVRRREAKIRHVNLAETIEAAAFLLRRTLFRDTVELRVDIEDGLWGARLDPEDLETALVTLCADLRDGLAQGEAVTVEARNVAVSKGTLSRADLEGEFVRITVGSSSLDDMPVDRGRTAGGMFTMQDMDLSSWVDFNRTLHFLQPLGGMADVTTLGTKTVVALYLPKAKAPSQAHSAARGAESVDGRAPQHVEILIVEDEMEVAFALQAMLEELGYLARIATDARQALKTLKARKLGLLLVDVAMPGPMNGAALAREARAALPDLPVLLITGNPAVMEDASEFPLLRKPVVSRDLHVTIQRQLAPDAGKVVSLFPRAARRVP
ncbi:response regulator [Microvirga thermotolerans]|uniref:Response regulator n=1 Tax=Microvirga thermotolerans TaxID=2651334 RepID=A0A5P9K0A4_9HYPH|nr:response regulator [Microvirga thermotolerans]QFU17861.1 response regulator [Microvirga thermotolerans]